MRERINYLNSKDIEMSRLLTAGIGLSGEVGEFNEIIKKIMFQEKAFDVVAHEHMRRELGDIMWYVAQACLALKVDLVDVINGNKEKLSKRFPQKQFDEKFDANRKTGDV
jgi:NTP pyrophosphatase (non-canonical NTP hydrolase)